MAKDKNFIRTPQEAAQVRSALMRSNIGSSPTVNQVASSLAGSDTTAPNDNIQQAPQRYDKKPFTRKALEWTKENPILGILVGLFSALIIMCLVFVFDNVRDIASLEARFEAMHESLTAVNEQMVSKEKLENELELLENSSSFELLINQKEIENRLNIIELQIANLTSD